MEIENLLVTHQTREQKERLLRDCFDQYELKEYINEKGYTMKNTRTKNGYIDLLLSNTTSTYEERTDMCFERPNEEGHFLIEDWVVTKTKKQHRIHGHEIYPKKVVETIQKHLTNKKVSEALVKGYEHKLDDKEKKQRMQSQRQIIKGLLSKCKDWECDDNYVTVPVEYKQQNRRGRFSPVKSQGLATIARQMRWTLGKGILTDIDIKNCHPEILNQLIEKFGKYNNDIPEQDRLLSKNETLSYYIDNREEVLTTVQSELNQAGVKGVNRDMAKQYLLKLMNQGGKGRFFDKLKKDSFIRRYYDDIQTTLKEMYHDMTQHDIYKPLKFKDDSKKKTTKTHLGSTSNHFLIYYENLILQAMVEKVTELGKKVAVLSYDGMMIFREFDEEIGFVDEPNINDEELRKIERHVYEKTRIDEYRDGFKIHLEVKPFGEGIDIESLSSEPTPNSFKLPTDKQLLQTFIENHSQVCKIFEDVVYFYDDERKLWDRCTKYRQIGSIACRMMEQYYETTLTDEKQIEEIQGYLQKLKTYEMMGKLITNVDIRYQEPIDNVHKFNRSYPYLLPIKDGKVINLKTLKVSKRKPHHMFTFFVNREYIDDDNFEDIEEHFRKYMIYKDEDDNEHCDDETFESLRKALGYSLTGDISQKMIFFLQGESNSGKSSLFDTLSPALGSGVIDTFNQSIILKNKNGSQIETEHAKLEEGLRFTYCSEFSTEQSIDGPKIKRLTGDQKINYRPMRANNRIYVPCAKFWLFTNEPPKIAVNDSGMMTRLVTFHFRNVFEKSRSNIEEVERIRSQPERVFSWLVECAFEYLQDQHIPITESMKMLKQEITEDLNPLTFFSSRYSLIYTSNEMKQMKENASDEDKNKLKQLLSFDQLYEDYINWSMGSNYQMGLSKFKSYVPTVFEHKIDVNYTINGKRVRRLYGYRKIDDNHQYD